MKFSRVVGNKTEEQVRNEIALAKEQIRKSNEQHMYEREQALSQQRAVRNDKIGVLEQQLTRINLDDVLKQYSKDTGNSTFLIARSRVGKSHMLCKLIEKLMVWNDQLIPIIFAGNPSSEPYKMLSGKIPIISGYRPSVVETLKTINDWLPEDRQYHFLVVLDDILDARNSSSLRNICLSYRNVNISSIISIQSPTLVQRNVRNSATCYMMGQTTGQETVGLLEKFLQYMPYFKQIRNKDDQHAELNLLTKDHEFLAYFPLNPDDRLYRIKAPP